MISSSVFKSLNSLLFSAALVFSLAYLAEVAKADIDFEGASESIEGQRLCLNGQEPVYFDGEIKELKSELLFLKDKVAERNAKLKKNKKLIKEAKSKKKHTSKLVTKINILSKATKKLQAELKALTQELAALEAVCGKNTSNSKVSAAVSSGSAPQILSSNPASPVLTSTLPINAAGKYILELHGQNFQNYINTVLEVKVLSSSGAVRRTLFIQSVPLSNTVVKTLLNSVAQVNTIFTLYAIAPGGILHVSNPFPISFIDSVECADGVDNDGDGRVDYNDMGCTGDGDTSEGGVVQGTVESTGWTNFDPPAGAVVIYVDSTLGNDNFNGLHQAPVSGLNGPKRTISAAMAAVPANPSASQVLLRRGRTFPQGIPYFRSGVSSTERFVFGSYGPYNEALPVVPHVTYVAGPSFASVRHVAVSGINFANGSLAAHNMFEDLLIEGSRFKQSPTAIDLQGNSSNGRTTNVKVRRNVIEETQSNSVYLDKITNLEFEYNVIHKASTVAGGNHGVYQMKGVENANHVFTGNLANTDKQYGNIFMLRQGAQVIKNLLLGYGWSAVTAGACGNNNTHVYPNSCVGGNVSIDIIQNIFVRYYSAANAVAAIGCRVGFDVMTGAANVLNNLAYSGVAPNCYSGPWGAAPSNQNAANFHFANNTQFTTAVSPLITYQQYLGRTPTELAFWQAAIAESYYKRAPTPYSVDNMLGVLTGS